MLCFNLSKVSLFQEHNLMHLCESLYGQYDSELKHFHGFPILFGSFHKTMRSFRKKKKINTV